MGKQRRLMERCSKKDKEYDKDKLLLIIVLYVIDWRQEARAERQILIARDDGPISRSLSSLDC